MNTRVLKALILIVAALPLASFGGQAAGLAPGQKINDATDHLLAKGPPPGKGGDEAEEDEEEEEQPADAPLVVAPRNRRPSNETRALERALNELAQADAAALADLRDAFKDEVDELEAELDELEADLDDRDAELDEVGDKNGVDGSPQLRRAEDKLRELENRVREVGRQLQDIRRRALAGGDVAGLLAEVRALGVAIDDIRWSERVELGALIEAAERRERGGPPDKDKKEEEEEAEPSPGPTDEP